MFDSVSIFSGPHSRLSAEDALLICCARTWVPPERIREVLNPDLDWKYITESAISHRIAPLLYCNLRKVSDELAPPKIMKELRETHTVALAHNILAHRGLSEILGALLDLQIEVIVLKGMAPAEMLYPEPALRPFSDVDLLILEDDRHRVAAELSRLGYKLLYDYRPGFAQQFGYELCYIKSNSVSLDLHWHVAGLPYSRYIDVARFWESAVPLNIEGIDVLVLSLEDLLIHLCLHASKESYSMLLWLVDISETVHRYGEEIDWDLFLEKVEQYRIHSLMRYVLRSVEKLFASAVPAFISERLHRHRSSHSEEWVLDALGDPNIAGVKDDMAAFLALDGIVPKMRYLLGKLLPGRDFMNGRYSDKRLCTAYCSRMVYGLQGGVKTLLQIWANSRTKG